MTNKRKRSILTYERLESWQSSSAEAERMAAQILLAEGFTSVDPSQPLGGPDGLKDVVCARDGIKWIAAVHFTRKPITFVKLKAKFLADAKGVDKNKAAGFVFFTNQKLAKKQRTTLESSVAGCRIEVYHLELISSRLNQPIHFALRWDVLDIEMTKEEFLSFVEAGNRSLKSQFVLLAKKMDHVLQGAPISDLTGVVQLPLSELYQFKELLDQITGMNPFYGFNSYGGLGIGSIPSLYVPLAELREFSDLLTQITGGWASGLGGFTSSLNGLQVPLEQLKEYEATLDGILQKRVLLDLSLPKQADQ